MARLCNANGNNWLTHNPGASPFWGGLTSWTISAWVYPLAFQGNASIVTVQLSGRINMALGIGNEVSGIGTNVPYAAYWTGSAWQKASFNSGIPLNRWSFLLAHNNAAAGQLRIYVNGDGGASNTPGNLNGSAGNVPLRIGRRWDGADGSAGVGFPGYLAEIAVWNGPIFQFSEQHWPDLLWHGMTPLDIPNPVPGYGSQLLAYWPMGGIWGSRDEGFERELYAARTASLVGAPGKSSFHAPLALPHYVPA